MGGERRSTVSKRGTLAWLLGSRGSLGSGLVREIKRRRDWEVLAADKLQSHDTEALLEGVRRTFRSLLTMSEERQLACSIMWVAGSATTSTDRDAADHELTQFRLAMEEAAVALGREAGVPVLVGRISNL